MGIKNRRHWTDNFWHGLVAWLLLQLLVNSAAASEDCLTVIYAEVPKPYVLIQEEIIGGIEQASDLPLRRYILSPDEQQGTSNILLRPQCKAMIVIGRAGLNAVSRLSGKGVVVIGGVLMVPGEPYAIPVVSLMPDPEVLFVRALHFKPEIKRIAVVYGAEGSGRMIAAAEKAARAMGLELISYSAHDRKQALEHYRTIFSRSRPGDALWLTYDNVALDERVLLPFVLRNAWNKGLVVFSSRAAHARNGALFSVFADNAGYGGELAGLVKRCLATGCGLTAVIGVRDVDVAVNIRTAAHLGVKIDVRNDPYVNLVFPNE